jgi:hypothetical protein
MYERCNIVASARQHRKRAGALQRSGPTHEQQHSASGSNVVFAVACYLMCFHRASGMQSRWPVLLQRRDHAPSDQLRREADIGNVVVIDSGI